MGLVADSPGSLTQIYAPIREELDQVGAEFDRELISDRPFVNTLCEQIKRYRGKMLRPALLLLAGKASGELTADHVTLGAVVEMVHIATLVHDDVLDEADLRRRQTTVNRVAGNEAAVLLGDYLISHAFHLCSSLGSTYAAREIGATTNTVCEGELTQVHNRGNIHLTEAQYLEIVRAKTGALTGAACALGARFAEAAPSVTDQLHQFGTEAGVAFQVIDDVLDLTGSEGRVGKSLGRDLDLGKPTLPLIHALATASPGLRTRLEALIRGESGPDLQEVRSLLIGAGSIAYATSVARDYVRFATRRLEALADSAARRSLTAMAEFILRRDH